MTDPVTDDQRLRAAAAALARAEHTTSPSRAAELTELARRWCGPLTGHRVDVSSSPPDPKDNP